ncbi:POT family-domain-containing protein [Absidia repens]|uniref:POT family-domain-containing protein n=1 Tax=Absidia repens TaxID=90262 RepID=A0A1X2J1N9_9FUNG|nr:POT family-domain-containing protein [Absidia repens]
MEDTEHYNNNNSNTPMSEKTKEHDRTYEGSIEESPDYNNHDGELFGPEPTDEDWKLLPEVSDAIPKAAYLVILVEFCERFTYYGLSGPFQNYVQYDNPSSYPADQPGAMGKGQQTATALTTFFQFWCYITPAIVGDQFLGKYKTIVVFSIIYLIGLVILTATASPMAISNGAAFPGFIVSLIIVGLGTGGIKANVSPLVAEQYRSRPAYVKTLKNGNRVIVTSQATYQKIFNMFYWGINVGSLSAIATTELEKNVGFWPAYLLPTAMFVPCIIVVILGRNQYVQNPPRGSVFVEAGEGGMEACKPSNLLHTHPDMVAKATWDDIFVDELRRALRACVVFCWFPIYWLCYSQMTNNLVSMAGRISCGFFFASVAMGYSAGIQSMVYNAPPNYDHPDGPNDISAAYIIPSYFFIAFSEIFAVITGMEYAYKKAPQSMKSIVMALFLLTNCFASILAFALVSVAVDPKLKWMYTGISITAAVCCVLFYVCHYKNDAIDKEEDAIVRSDSQMQDYEKVDHLRATVEYEVEKGAV